MPALLSALAAAVFQGSLTGQITDGRKPLADAVVWLEGPGAKQKPAPAKVVQKGRAFIPRILVVPVGSKVEFPNQDAIYHNVFSHSSVKRFDLGMYPKGQSRSVLMDRPGVVSVLCNIHAEMSAYIVVTDGIAAIKTDREGRFRFPGLEAGQYRIWAWHEKGGRASAERAVGSSEASVSLRVSK